MPYQLLNPWPDDALRFTSAVERVGRLIVAARRDFSTNWDLTIPSWRVLRLLDQSDERFDVAKVARRLGIARQSAHATVDGLRRIGMLESHELPADRRFRTLVLTEGGADCLSDLDAAMRALLLEVTSEFSREALQETTRLLDRLTKRLRSCEAVLRRRARRRVEWRRRSRR
jgi:DNA-binding MarR family transcriptional regulator